MSAIGRQENDRSWRQGHESGRWFIGGRMSVFDPLQTLPLARIIWAERNNDGSRYA